MKNNSRFFGKNIKFLLNLNKDKNGYYRNHFLKEIRISYATLNRWEKGGEVWSKYINATVNYFNRYLHLKLKTEDIQYQDLQLVLKNSLDQVKEPDLNYNLLTEDEKKLLELYELMPEEERRAFIEFLEKRVKSTER